MPALLLVFVLALQCIGSSPLKAAVLADETIAPVTPVIETDLSALLQGRVAEASRIGLFAREQARTRESMRRHLRRPASSGQNGALTGALRDASYDVTLIPREQLANMTPTARRAVQSLVRTYLLLDADDAAQVAWGEQRASTCGRYCDGACRGAGRGYRAVAAHAGHSCLRRSERHAEESVCGDGAARPRRRHRGAGACLDRGGRSSVTLKDNISTQINNELKSFNGGQMRTLVQNSEAKGK